MSKNVLVKNNYGKNLGSNTQHVTTGGGLNWPYLCAGEGWQTRGRVIIFRALQGGGHFFKDIPVGRVTFLCNLLSETTHSIAQYTFFS